MLGAVLYLEQETSEKTASGLCIRLIIRAIMRFADLLIHVKFLVVTREKSLA